jgi:hypothetical protein
MGFYVDKFALTESLSCAFEELLLSGRVGIKSEAL